MFVETGFLCPALAGTQQPTGLCLLSSCTKAVPTQPSKEVLSSRSWRQVWASYCLKKNKLEKRNKALCGLIRHRRLCPVPARRCPPPCSFHLAVSFRPVTMGKDTCGLRGWPSRQGAQKEKETLAALHKPQPNKWWPEIQPQNKCPMTTDAQQGLLRDWQFSSSHPRNQQIHCIPGVAVRS